MKIAGDRTIGRVLVNLAALVLLSAGHAWAASGDAFSLEGYVRETPLAWKAGAYLARPGGRLFTNLLHTRQNLRWYPSGSATFALEIKTRALNGDAAGAFLSQTDFPGTGESWFNGQRVFVERERFVLVSAVDRAWITVYLGAVQTTLGRQRIAWGTNLVWNPIDLFNPSSPLDFDNEEKPGNDAVRVQAYLGPNSKVEAAAAPAREADRTTAAVNLTLNGWGYDWVVLAGRRRTETVIGGAWAGSIRGGGFRGELLRARPRKAALAMDAYFTGSVEADYAFASSLYLHGAVLYNSAGEAGDAGGLLPLAAYARGWLSPAQVSVFGEIARDLTPLVRVDLAGILNPRDHSGYLGPALRWSVMTNLDLTLMGLFFGGDSGTEFGDSGEIAMARAKYSF